MTLYELSSLDRATAALLKPEPAGESDEARLVAAARLKDRLSG